MFKSVSVAGLFIFTQTVSAAAIDANSSWDEIMSSQQHAVTLPMIDFVTKDPSKSASTIPVTDVCLSDKTTFRSKEKKRIFKRSTSGRGDNRAPAGEDFLYTDRTSTQRRCVANGRSCEWKSESVEIPLKYDIQVRQKSSRGSGRVLFTKTYTIAECS